jgi:hypothetical protein
MVAPQVMHHLSWLAVSSLVFASLASVCWYFARRWHTVHAPL